MTDKDMIREKLDCELENMVFSEESKSAVILEVKRPQSRIRRVLEKEILFPVTPVVTVLVLLAMGLSYISFGAFKVNDEDIRKSQIIVIEEMKGSDDK